MRKTSERRQRRPAAATGAVGPSVFGTAGPGTVDRRAEILAIAWRLFSSRGLTRTSMRDIAAGAGLLAGSLYHHFPSKEALYLEVHGATLRWSEQELRRAADGQFDPWERLAAACRRHLEIQVAPDSPTFPLMNDLPAASPKLRKALIAQRDQFERLYVELVEALPLAAGLDRHVYRLALLSLLNTLPHWFRSGRLSVDEVAAQLLRIFGQPQPQSVRGRG